MSENKWKLKGVCKVCGVEFIYERKGRLNGRPRVKCPQHARRQSKNPIRQYIVKEG